MEIPKLKTITEMKNPLEGLNNRFNLEEERVCKPEGRSIKTIQSQEQEKKRMKKNGQLFYEVF